MRRAYALSRADAEVSVFNLWHEPLLPSEVDRRLLPLLDGTRDRDALLAMLLADHRDDPIPDVTERDLEAAVDGLPARLRELKLA